MLMSATLAIRNIQPGMGRNGGPALEDHMVAHRRGRVVVIAEATGHRPIRLVPRNLARQIIAGDGGTTI